MRVLVTGGTGVVGTATVTELLRRGHTVRLLSRHATEESRQWPYGVEAWDASVADADAIRGAAEGCGAVVHLVAIVSESPPEATFERVNVQGTRNVVAEAERAQVVRLVYISSLGCDRGSSPYHKSKLEGEQIALASSVDTTVLRISSIYGPGDEIISLLVKMVRTLPAVPTINDGDDVFQPMWVEDAAQAIVTCMERDDLNHDVLEIAGPDTTSMNDVIDRLRKLTGREPVAIPVPGVLAVLGSRLAAAVGMDVPLDAGQVTMLEEGNVIHDPAGNALDRLGVTPTSLADGLAKLVDALPEQLPDAGVGALMRKRVWADIAGATLSPELLFERFRTRFAELTPDTMDMGAEPGTPAQPTEGATITMALPVRGNVQVRVEELTPRSMTLITLEGHPLAGAVRFLSEQRGEDVRFEVQVYDRPANAADWMVMRSIGQPMQLATWRTLVERVVNESGGRAPDGVQTDVESLDALQAERVEAWLRDLVLARKRDETAAQTGRGASAGSSPNSTDAQFTDAPG